MIHPDDIIIQVKGVPIDRPPFVRGHYRKWAMRTMRDGALHASYQAWRYDDENGVLLPVDSGSEVDWTAFDRDSGPYAMALSADPARDQKPWIVFDRESGTVISAHASPFEANGAIVVLEAALRT